MRLRLLTGSLLIASVALAQPSDAPTLPDPTPIHKGEAAPADGAFMPTTTALYIAEKCRRAEFERDALAGELEKESGSTNWFWPVVFAFLAGSLAGGVVVAVSK